MTEEPEWGIRRDDKGIHGSAAWRMGERWRVMVTEQHVGQVGTPVSRPCAISARRSSPSTGPITGFTVPPGSPGSPI